MQGEVSQLVPKGPVEVVAIGAQKDRAGTGERNGGTPGWSPAAGERVQRAAIGNYDELKRTGRAQAQTGPVGRTAGPAGQVEGKLALAGPCNDGNLSQAHCGGLSLKRCQAVPERH
jgi:hypothetical protein